MEEKGGYDASARGWRETLFQARHIRSWGVAHACLLTRMVGATRSESEAGALLQYVPHGEHETPGRKKNQDQKTMI